MALAVLVGPAALVSARPVHLEIFVAAHPDRAERAERLADQIGASAIVWDRNHDARDTHQRAWQELAAWVEPQPEHWGMVVEDDALACAQFRAGMRASLAVAPATVVSAYLGRGRPIGWQHSIARVMATRTADWLLAQAVLSGVGLAIRGDRIAELLAYRQRRPRTEPMDELMNHWVTQRSITVAYQHPSLLSHDPNLPSVIGPDRERPPGGQVPEVLGAHLDPDHRTAWWWESKLRWTNVCAVIPAPPS